MTGEAGLFREAAQNGIGDAKGFVVEPSHSGWWGRGFHRERREIANPDARVQPSVCNPTVPLELVGREGDPYLCPLLGIAQGRAHLRSEISIPESWRVMLHFGSLSIPGEVLYSKKDGEGWRICIGIGSELERGRMEPRFPINQAGEITILNPVGSITSNCVVTNISRSGLGLTAAEPADTGAMVYIVGNFGLVVGEVRHCRQGTDGRYRMGVETMGVYANFESAEPHPIGIGKLRRLTNKLRWKMAETIAGKRLAFYE